MITGFIDPAPVIRQKSADSRNDPARIRTGHGQHKVSQGDPFRLKIIILNIPGTLRTGEADRPVVSRPADQRW